MSESTMKYDPNLTSSGNMAVQAAADAEHDAMYADGVAFVRESRRASISAVQRKLLIGYNRAARMIERMEVEGVVTAANSNGAREVIR